MLPIFERLGDVHRIFVARVNIALTLLARAQPGDRESAADLVRLALRDAERLRIPEAEQIQQIQKEHGL